MNKTLLAILLVAVAILSGAYWYIREEPGGDAVQKAQIANPASVNCVETLGGQLEIVDEAAGQAGYCHLPDGRVCGEWGLFRDDVCNAPKAPAYGTSPKDAMYRIDGAAVTLVNGVAETAVAPGSASKIITRYFGNELATDLDGDGREDVVFILTQETGGSGVFYYAVAALNTPEGWLGSDGFFLGDRIAPQTTEVSRNPRHKFVVVVNYADRAPGESMTARPSLGKSAYLKLDTERMQWGIVESDFEGESR